MFFPLTHPCRTIALALLLLVALPSSGFASANEQDDHRAGIEALDAHLDLLESKYRGLDPHSAVSLPAPAALRSDSDVATLDRLRAHLRALETLASTWGPEATTVLDRLRAWQRELNRPVSQDRPSANGGSADVGSATELGRGLRSGTRTLVIKRKSGTKTAAPTNDFCPAAQPITDGSFVAELAEARQDGISSCDPPEVGEDVWFRYTPAANGFVTAEITSLGEDFSLSVHTGCPGTQLNQITCTTFDPLVFETTAGQDVWIRVAGAGAFGVGSVAARIEPAAVLSGRVTEEVSGQPVADATVGVFRDDEFPLSQGRSAADGTYRVPVPGAGTYIALASAPGYRSEAYDDIPCPFDPEVSCFPNQGEPISIPAGATVAGIDFALDRLGRISGQIRDATNGAPVPFATVNLNSDFSGNSFFADATGRYGADSLEPGDWKVFVSSSLYQDELWDDIPCQFFCDPLDGTSIVLDLNTDAQGIDFDLEPLGRISGRVTAAATGAPIAFLPVDIYHPDGFVIAGAITNSDGEYTVGGLETGAYRAKTFARFSGFVDELFPEIPCVDCDLTLGEQISVTRGEETTNIDFTLDAGGEISGRITSAGTGLGLQGASLILFDSAGFFERAQASGDNGSYIFSRLQPGMYFLRASFPEHQLEVYEGSLCFSGQFCDPTAGTPIPVAAATATSGIDITLEPQGIISGTVRDAASGQPVAGARLFVVDDNGLLDSRGQSDDNGRYRLALEPETYRVVAEHPGYLAEVYLEHTCSQRFVTSCNLDLGQRIPSSFGDEATAIDFTLERLGSISGQARGTDGRPVPGVEVTATSAGREFFTETDEEGRYLLEGLDGGNYFLATRSTFDGYLATVHGGASCDTQTCDPSTGTPLVVVNGQNIVADFTLDRRGVISGRVTDGIWGDPLHASIAIWDSEGDFVTTFSTDNQGRYEAVRLVDGSYFVTALVANLLSELYPDQLCLGLGCDKTQGTAIHVGLNLEATDIDFELGVQQGIAGTATSLDSGFPIAGLQIEVHDANGEVDSTLTGPTGHYFFALPIGTYTLRTRASSSDLVDGDQVYDGIDCPEVGPCDPSIGTPVAVAGDQIVGNIDFALAGNVCTPSDTSLCLNQGRFRVRATYSDFDGNDGAAQGEALTADSGTFTFFDPDNIELVVKVLDACGSAFDSYWVFAAGLTNLGVDLEVTDTVARETNLYPNVLGSAFELVRDTAAFATCHLGLTRADGALTAGDIPAISSGLDTELQRLAAGGNTGSGHAVDNKADTQQGSETCVPSDTALCLQQGRFRIEATWTDTTGAAGIGTAVQLTPDTGTFWFFDADNIEVILKVLDACGSPFDSYWIFAAGLTDVGVVLRVTDTVSGQVEEYQNQLGQGFVPIQDTATFQTCP